VDVADTGSGIPAEHLPHLFDRFYRVDKARSREAGGSGLGLSIARRIAEAHGGSLTVSSEVGRGATFTLTLPLPLSPPETPLGQAAYLGRELAKAERTLKFGRPYGQDGAGGR